MICGSYDNCVRRQGVNLKQERTDNALYLTSLVNVSAFLGKRIKFIKKEDATFGTRLIKQQTQPICGFAEKATDDSFIANHQERNHKRFRDRLC